MRASMAPEPRSHCDTRTPITGVAQSRVSVSLGCQSWADAERPKDDTHLGQTPRIERVSVEIGKVLCAERDVKQKSLQGSIVFQREHSPTQQHRDEFSAMRPDELRGLR